MSSRHHPDAARVATGSVGRVVALSAMAGEQDDSPVLPSAEELQAAWRDALCDRETEQAEESVGKAGTPLDPERRAALSELVRDAHRSRVQRLAMVSAGSAALAVVGSLGLGPG